jgi:predicted secreted protein
MAIFNGTDLILKVSPSDGGTAAKLMHSTSVSLDIAMDTIDVSTKDSAGFLDIIGGQKSFSLSADGLMDFNPTTVADTEVDELTTQMLARTKVTFSFTLATTATGDYFYSGSGFLTSITISGGVEDAPTYSCTIQGTAALTVTTV